jgi:hypothetical protein
MWRDVEDNWLQCCSIIFFLCTYSSWIGCVLFPRCKLRWLLYAFTRLRIAQAPRIMPRLMSRCCRWKPGKTREKCVRKKEVREMKVIFFVIMYYAFISWLFHGRYYYYTVYCTTPIILKNKDVRLFHLFSRIVIQNSIGLKDLTLLP